LLNQEKSLLKFRGQMQDVGREQAQAKYAEVESEVQRRLGTSKVEARINGLEYLYDRTHAERISNMLVGLLIAILIVTLVLGYLFKDITLAMMALLLNIIPIFLGAGVMGLTNLELRAGTSIVFTIAFVIAVDDTIHFLTKYRWERKRGSDVESAIQATLKQCGSAIFATSAILVGAFLILMVSSLEEIAAFGFLTAVIIILALLLDLLLLPILIRRSVREKSDEEI
jgi:predicted RND superfamily exporter protein